MRLKYLLFFLPFAVIAIVNRNLILATNNPSWGDMVAIPPVPLPFTESLIHVWRDIFTGGFGPTNIPHLLLSQLTNGLPSSILQAVYLFFLFFILFITFIDLLPKLSDKKDLQLHTLLEANLLVLIIYFSNTFIVNFIQGNPDIYYGYLLGIPIILYLYLFFRDRNILPGLKIILLVTLANIFGSFSIFYLSVLVIPFIILFSLKFYNRISFKYLFILSILIIVSNSFLLFATIKPIIYAVNFVGGAGGKEIIDTSFSLYKAMNPMQLFYFAGNFGDVTWLLFNIPGGDLFLRTRLYAFSSLQMVIVLFLCMKSLASKKKINEKHIFLGVLSIFVIYFTLLMIWDTAYFESLARNIPFIALYRNPKKIVLSLFVIYIVTIFFSKLFVSPKYFRYSLLAILFFTFLPISGLVSDGYNGLKNAYFVSSDFYHQNSGDRSANFDRLINYPTRYVQLKKELDNLNSSADINPRIIVMPDNSQTLYQGQLFYLLNPFYINVNAAVYGQLNDTTTLMNELYTSLIQGRAKVADELLHIANVKYVIVDRKSNYNSYAQVNKPTVRNYYGTFTTGDPEEFKKILDLQSTLQLQKKTDDFYIYVIKNYKSNVIAIPQHSCLQTELESKKNCEFFESTSLLNENSSAHISSVKRVSPTHYVFSLTVSKPEKIPLFFNQTYDRFWEIVPHTDGVKITDHRIGNFYGNSWNLTFPRKGDYTFDISYSLEKPYLLLVGLSGLTIFSTIIAIIVLTRRQQLS